MSRRRTRAEVERVEGPGGSRPRGRWTSALVTFAVCVVVVAGGWGGRSLLVAGEPRGSSRGTGLDPSAPAAPDPGGSLEVSGSRVGAHPFGTDSEEVLAALGARLGEPDLRVGPQRYVRRAGGDAWFEDAEDPLSPSWRHRFSLVTCWGTLCLIFGGEEGDTLRLRGWELARHRRWSGFEELQDVRDPDVRLAGTDIRLGDSWRRLHAAYPSTVVRGAEGASLAVLETPWTTVSDGAAGWRLSGHWDPARPAHVPAGAVMTRLSGGEGPQPGCC